MREKSFKVDYTFFFHHFLLVYIFLKYKILENVSTIKHLFKIVENLKSLIPNEEHVTNFWMYDSENNFWMYDRYIYIYLLIYLFVFCSIVSFGILLESNFYWIF